MADIVITEADLSNPLETKLHSNADGTRIQLSEEKDLSVLLGAPLDSEGKFYFPASPHILITDQLFVRDKDHPQGFVINDVAVIMAHGVRRNGGWEFLNGQPVNETVTEYNKWADLNKMPVIEAVISCNEEPVAKESGIQVYEFQQGGPNPFVIHAVGEEIQSACYRETDGKLWTKIETNKTNLLNLDEAITTRQIKILP